MTERPARRDLMKGLGLASLGAALSAHLDIEGQAEKGVERSIYVGTYTSATSRGIHLLRFDPVTGSIKVVGLAAEVVNPSYLAIAPGGRHLCAVNEVGTFNGQPVGGLTTFAISPQDGLLRQINQVSSGGASPCYVSLDPAGRHVLAANYSGGNLIVVRSGRMEFWVRQAIWFSIRVLAGIHSVRRDRAHTASSFHLNDATFWRSIWASTG